MRVMAQRRKNPGVVVTHPEVCDAGRLALISDCDTTIIEFYYTSNTSAGECTYITEEVCV